MRTPFTAWSPNSTSFPLELGTIVVEVEVAVAVAVEEGRVEFMAGDATRAFPLNSMVAVSLFLRTPSLGTFRVEASSLAAYKYRMK